MKRANRVAIVVAAALAGPLLLQETSFAQGITGRSQGTVVNPASFKWTINEALV